MTAEDVIGRFRREGRTISVTNGHSMTFVPGRRGATNYAQCGLHCGGKLHYEVCKAGNGTLSVELHDERGLVDDLRRVLFACARSNQLKCSNVDVISRFRVCLGPNIGCEAASYDQIADEVAKRLDWACRLFDSEIANFDLITECLQYESSVRKPSVDEFLALEETLANDRRVNEIRQAILEIKRSVRKFNILSVLGLSDYEIRHSFMLTWLLKPSGNHGLGDEFLRRFLSAIKNENPAYEGIVGFGKDAAQHDISVDREVHSIDILLVDRHNKIVVVVENKWNADEHDDQLTRYQEYVDETYLKSKGWRKYCVFLTPTGRRPSRDDWSVLSYSGVLVALEAVLAKIKRGEVDMDVAVLVKHYAAIVRRKINMEDVEIEKKCNEIFEEHKEVLSYIFKRVDKNLMRHPLLVADQGGLHIGNELLMPEGDALTYVQYKRRLPAGRGASVHYEIEKPRGNDRVVLWLHIENDAHEWVVNELPVQIRKLELPDGFELLANGRKVKRELRGLDMGDIEGSRKRVLAEFQKMYKCCEPLLREFDRKELEKRNG